MAPSQSQRAANACENCRKRKVKCSGEQPCGSCRRHKWHCSFGAGGRSRYSESYVQNLLSKIKSYEQQTSEQPAQLANTDGPTLNGFDETQTDEQATNEEVNNLLQLNDTSTSPATDCAPGRSFETQARSLLHARHSQKTSPTHLGDDNGRNELHSGVTADDEQPQGAHDLIENIPLMPIPSQADSFKLMESFLYYLGVTQHFFDPRAFADSITMLFRNPSSREAQKKSIWYTQYLLVMGMAKLIQNNESRTDEKPPGVEYFAEAMRRLPNIYQLRANGVPGVEVLLVAALYLGWCDRTHEAYFYTGVALRLAIDLGCSKPWKEQSCLPSEASHRVRLWWTVYMLDRRLSAGLGLPVGSDDRQMIIEMPPHSAGFQSPVPLIMNVRIARATGEIMSSLYGNAEIKQIEVIQKIQHVLQSLYETGRSFPQEHMIDFSRPLLNLTRTAASLHLMLFQAIILCVRPIVLQRVRLVVSAAREGVDILPPQDMAPAVARLCQTANEAAVKSLLILSELQRKDMLPRFGYFDLDATFSAAFILVMIGAMDMSSSADAPPHEIGKACEVLRYLAQAGNKAAARRLEDIRQFCTHVWSLDPNPSPEATMPMAATQEVDKQGRGVNISNPRNTTLSAQKNIDSRSEMSEATPGTGSANRGRGSGRTNIHQTGRDSDRNGNLLRDKPTLNSGRMPASRNQRQARKSSNRQPSGSDNSQNESDTAQRQGSSENNLSLPHAEGDNNDQGQTQLLTNDTNMLLGFDQLYGDAAMNFDFDLGPEEMDGIYSSFNDPDLPLTGVDYADWLEMEKLFSLAPTRDANDTTGNISGGRRRSRS